VGSPASTAKSIPEGSAHQPRTSSTTNLGEADKRNNVCALLGFILGCCLPLAWIGIIPLAGVILSFIGLGTFNPKTEKNYWMGGVGLGLSLLGFLVFLSSAGYLN
jgi:hypothetical protein